MFYKNKNINTDNRLTNRSYDYMYFYYVSLFKKNSKCNS